MTVDVTALAIKVESVGIRDASQALGGLSTSASNATKRVDTLVAAMKALNTVNLAAAQSSDAFIGRLRQQATLITGLDASLTGARAGAAGLAAAMANLSASLVILNAQLSANTTRQRASNQAMEEGRGLARGLAGSLGALWVTYGNFAGMAAGIAIGASLKAVVSVGKDVQHTLEEIRVLGGASTQEISQMSQVIRDLGQGSQGPRDVAEALQVLTLAGLNATEAMRGVGAALNLAVAGSVSIEKSAETLVQVSTSLGYTADGFDHVADVIAKAAAASMSSVDSISGAFKSASSVGEVYGATLQDLAVGLAAIANLGIQGTAAGTALKNFYKDLTSGSEKATVTLKSMKLAVSDFRDSEGYVLPLVDIITKLNDGLGNLTGSARNDAIGKLFGERGIKEAAALLKMVNTASDQFDEMGNKYKNRLVELADDIKKAAGFSTTAAIAMSQTASNQMKSVANTLQTVFAEAFKNMQPQIGQVSRALKEAFTSKEFTDGLRTIITGVVELTKFLIEHIGVIGDLVKAYAAFKVAEFAVGLVKVAQGFQVASVASRAFLVSLGPIGIAIGLLTAAWVLYKSKKTEALNNDAEGGNLQEYADNLTKAVTKENEALKMRQAGYTEMDIARKAQLNADRDASAAAVDASAKKMNEWRAQLNGQFAALSENEKTRVKMMQSGQTTFGSKATVDYVNSLVSFDKALGTHNDLVKKVATQTKELTDARNANAAAADAAALAARNARPTGEDTLLNKPDKSGISDAYARQVADYQNKIKAAKQAIVDDDRMFSNQVKAGEIGRMEAINKSTASQLENYDKIAKALDAQIAIAQRSKNKSADVERFTGEKEGNTEAIEQAKRKQAEETAVYLNELARENVRTEIKNLEDKGQYVAAATKRWDAEYKAMYESMSKDAEKYGSKFPQLITYVENLNKVQREMMDSAAVREQAKAFDALAQSMSNIVSGINTETAGMGFVEMFNTASDAAERYKQKLPMLQQELEKLRLAAEKSGTPDDSKRYEEAVGKQKKLADQYRKMWTDTARNIGNALDNAFGKSGKVAGEMVKTIVDYNNQDNQSMQAKAGLYGNLAGQAAGFFDKQSTGYKVMSGVSKAFYVAETAMALASIAPKIAAGAATMFAQSGWGGFAGVAAMIGLMAALGYSGSSGGSYMSSAQRQEKQGTGSVLGDSTAKSESISKSMDILAKNSGLGLAHSANSEKHLKNISANIGNLASLIVRTTGLTGSSASGVQEGTQVNGLVGGLSNVLSVLPGVGKLVSKLFGTTTTLVDQGISIAQASLEHISKAGVDAEAYATVNTKKKAFGVTYSNKTKDTITELDGDITTQFGLVISNMANVISNAADAIGIGGDAFTQKLNSFVVDIGKISFKDMKADEIEKALESVFSKLGDDMASFAVEGLSKYQQVGEGALETLARISNDFIQVSDVLAVLGKSFNVTGMAAIELSESLIDSAGGLEKLTEGTQFFIENFLTEAERMAPVIKSVDAELARLGQSNIRTADQFKALVMAQDLNTKAGQEMYAALINLAPTFFKAAEYTDKLADGLGDLTAVQQRAIDKLKATANNAFDVLQKAVEREQDAAEKKYDAEVKRIDSLKDQAEAAYAAQKEALTAALNAEKDRNSDLTGLQSSLKSALQTLLPTVVSQAVSRAQGQSTLNDALVNAKAGKFGKAEDLADALKAVTADSTSLFSSYNDYKKDAGMTAVTVSELEQLTGKAKTASDMQLEALNAALDTAEKQYKATLQGFDDLKEAARIALDSETERLDKIIEFAQGQLDVMNNNVIAITGLTGALVAFTSAVSAAISGINNAQIANGGTALTGSSNKDYVAELYKGVLGREGEASGMAYWQDMLEKGASRTDILQGFYNSPEYKQMQGGSHAGGLDDVPTDGYVAKLHKGEMVLPAASAKAVREDVSNAEVVEAIERLRADNSVENQAAVGDLRILRKLFQNASPDGTRIQVVVVPDAT
jgi:TP901 family phage tail tape measure protein